MEDLKIDKILIVLKQKEVDEQIRSNKVIEGVLADICNGVGRIADEIENKKFKFNKGTL